MATRPLIAICGTTGVGKSKLAIELALKLANGAHGFAGARIINADAMQVYAGMDIITNKVPLAEQRGIDHLLMGFKQPGEQYIVGQWVQDAIHLIDESHRNNQIPIVVGGTSYWIQHLFFPNRLSSNSETPLEPRSSSPYQSAALMKALSTLSKELFQTFENLPKIPPSATDDSEASFRLHALLSQLDPKMAQRWHWKDTRKVLRSLNIIQESGRLPSEIIGEQSSQVESLRYPTLCFWLYCNMHDLEPRLNNRVDQMIRQGLLKEITALRQMSRNQACDSQSTTDFTLGIYQSIGYKEFDTYLSSESPSQAQFDQAVNEMKTSTRKYAKRQIGWLRNKLLPSIRQATEYDQRNMYLLEANEPDLWDVCVRDPAMAITTAFLLNKELPNPTSISSLANQLLQSEEATMPSKVLETRRKTVCSVCTTTSTRPVMIEEGREWNAHITSKAHKRLAFKQSPEGIQQQEHILLMIKRRREGSSHNTDGGNHEIV